jgi:ABC-2 type transport system permease protein
MKNFKAVFSVILKNAFRRNKGSKGVSAIVATIIVSVIFGGYSLLGSFLIAPAFTMAAADSLAGEFCAFIIFAITMANVLFAIIPLITTLYMSKDNEILLALPVRSSTVFLARVLYVYLTQLFFTLVLVLPMIIVFGVWANMSAAYYLLMILWCALAPFIALVVASVLAVPIMFLTTLFKNKGVITSIALIVLFTVFFGAYYALIFNMNTGVFDPNNVYATLKPLLVGAPYSLAPFVAMGRSAVLSPYSVFGYMGVAGAEAVNIALSLGLCAAAMLLAFVIGGFMYRKGVAFMLESGSTKKTAKREIYPAKTKSRSVLSLMMSREIKTLLRNTSFAFNCLGTMPILIVFAVVFSISFGSNEIGLGKLGVSGLAFGMVYSMLTGMAISFNIGACTTFTREGEQFFILKTIPVDLRTVIKAKHIVYSLITVAFYVVAEVVAVFMTGSSPICILGILPGAALIVGTSAMDMLFDLRKPKLDWITPTEAVKNNTNTLIPMFISLGLILVLIGGFGIGFVLFPAYSMIAGFVMTSLLAIISLAVFLPVLYEKGPLMISAVE